MIKIRNHMIQSRPCGIFRESKKLKVMFWEATREPARFLTDLPLKKIFIPFRMQMIYKLIGEEMHVLLHLFAVFLYKVVIIFS